MLRLFLSGLGRGIVLWLSLPLSCLPNARPRRRALADGGTTAPMELNRASLALLRRLPFRMYETLAGVYDADADRFRYLPMAGFEADTRARAAFVRPFNALNRRLGRWTGRPLRLGIHPHDFELELADDLARWLRRGGRGLDYSALSR